MTHCYLLAAAWAALYLTSLSHTLESAAAFVLGVSLADAIKSMYTRVRVQYWLWRQRSCREGQRSCPGQQRSGQIPAARRPTLAPP